MNQKKNIFNIVVFISRSAQSGFYLRHLWSNSVVRLVWQLKGGSEIWGLPGNNEKYKTISLLSTLHLHRLRTRLVFKYVFSGCCQAKTVLPNAQYILLLFRFLFREIWGFGRNLVIYDLRNSFIIWDLFKMIIVYHKECCTTKLRWATFKAFSKIIMKYTGSFSLYLFTGISFWTGYCYFHHWFSLVMALESLARCKNTGPGS